MSITKELQQTINEMVDNTRGILAMDESSPTKAVFTARPCVVSMFTCTVFGCITNHFERLSMS